MRTDVEESLAEARDALPAADSVWYVEADNILGVLNVVRSSLDVGDAEDNLRQAKKTFIIGQRAEAFDDADDLAEEIETVADLIDDVDDAREQVGDLTATIPQLAARSKNSRVKTGRTRRRTATPTRKRKPEFGTATFRRMLAACPRLLVTSLASSSVS